MRTTSQAYKNEVARTIKRPVRFNGTLDLVNEDAMKYNEIDVHDNSSISVTSYLFEYVSVTKNIATFERSCFLLDGNSILIDDYEEIKKYNLELVFDKLYFNGEIYYQYINVSFDTIQTFKGIRIYFSERTDVIATHVTIIMNSASGSQSFAINNPEANVYISSDRMFSNITSLQIRIDEINLMYTYNRRPRITKIIFGEIFEMTSELIQGVVINDEANMTNTTLPTGTCNVEFIDNRGLFDPNNKTSFFNLLYENQPMDIQLLQLLENGEEVVKLGRYYLKTWKNETGNIIRFNFEDILTLLTTSFYHKGVFGLQNVYDAVFEVLTDAGLDYTQFNIDDRFKTMTFKTPLPYDTHKNCLQLLANFGCAIIDISENGILNFVVNDDVQNDFTIKKRFAINDTPKTEVLTLLTRLEVEMYSYTKEETITKLFEGFVVIDTADPTYIIQTKTSESTSIVVNCYIGEDEIPCTFEAYANSVVVSISGVSVGQSVDILVTGNLINTSSAVINVYTTNRDTGVVVIQNPLINTQQDAERIGNYNLIWLLNRFEHHITWRGDFALESLDNILVETLYDTKRGRVKSQRSTIGQTLIVDTVIRGD